MSAGGTYGTQGKPKSRLARGRGREGGRLSEDVSIQGAGSCSALIHFIPEAGTPLESLPLLERVFLLPRPGLGGATGGVKDPLEDAADQAPGGRPGWAGPGLRQKQQISGGGTGEGRTELAGGVPPGSAWGTHWAGLGAQGTVCWRQCGLAGTEVTPDHATRRGQQGVTAARQGGAQRSRPGHSDVRGGGLGGRGRSLGAHSPQSHRSCTPGEPAALCSPVRGWAWDSPDRLAPPTVPISQLRRRSEAGAGSGSMSPALCPAGVRARQLDSLRGPPPRPGPQPSLGFQEAPWAN